MSQNLQPSPATLFSLNRPIRNKRFTQRLKVNLQGEATRWDRLKVNRKSSLKTESIPRDEKSFMKGPHLQWNLLLLKLQGSIISALGLIVTSLDEAVQKQQVSLMICARVPMPCTEANVSPNNDQSEDEEIFGKERTRPKWDWGAPLDGNEDLSNAND